MRHEPRLWPLIPIAATVAFLTIDVPMLVLSPGHDPGAFVPFVLVPIVAAAGAGLIGIPILWAALRLGATAVSALCALGAFGGLVAGTAFVVAIDSTAFSGSSSALRVLWSLRGFGELGAVTGAIYWGLILSEMTFYARVVASVAALGIGGVLFVASAL